MILRTYLLLPIFILLSAFIAVFSSWFTPEERWAEPELKGDTGVCLSAASGFAYAEYTAGGDPSDVFNWSILDAAGFEVYSLAGQGVNKITFAYSVTGNYQVNLRVYRGSNQNYYQSSLAVIVQTGPVFNIPPDVVLCGNDAITITAVSDDPALNPNFSEFNFQWTNQAGTVVSTQNEVTITEEGRYFVTVSTPACSVGATTFAGPSIEVDVTPSTTIACLGQTVTYSPDVPINASWSYQKAGQSARTPLGKSFSLNLNTDNLEGLGDYTIFFNAEDANNPGCSVEQSFPLQINEGAEITLTKISDANECESTEGSFRITAVSGLDELTVVGVSGATFGSLAPGEERIISGLLPKTYVVTGKLNGCSISRLISINNLNFDDPIQFNVSLAEEGACSPSGLDRGAVALEFLDGPGSYSIYSSNGSEVSGTFEANDTIIEELSGGTYQVQVRDANNCTSPDVKTITVPSPRQVSFSVPATLTACEFFEFSPESDQDLSYVLTAPDGSTQTGTSQTTFRIEVSGTYSMLATHNDPNSGLCPRRRSIEATVNEQLQFDYSQRYIDCYGNQIFSAELGSMSPSDVVIRWRTAAGVIVGREREFYPPSTGDFTLDVQPRASSACPATPISFTVNVPQLTYPVEISASSFCGEDPFSTLTAEGDFVEIRQYQWFYTDSVGERSELLEFHNQPTIDVTDEGTYEVIVRRLEEPMCELGRASYILEKSEGISLDLNDEYQICTAENFFPTINPGSFETYNWLLDGVKVDSTSTFRPNVTGSYEIIVTDSNGCETSATFEVVETCVTLAKFPNALMPENPQKDFRIYLDRLVHNVET
ncbi:MAG TPA: hypothetical protein VKX33_11820, partial [Cyclobacteriaceae bacterium]|nr:hypothetical protein [Cyclobacteriaceae bacterium]